MDDRDNILHRMRPHGGPLLLQQQPHQAEASIGTTFKTSPQQQQQHQHQQPSSSPTSSPSHCNNNTKTTISNNNNSNSNTSSSSSSQSSPETSLLAIMPIEKEAPGYRAWYHGRLSRDESETRLVNSHLMPAFLLRESDKRPGSYVLSYLALDNTFNHYKITAMFGDYYIGGRQFDRLETLVSYYMFYSELKKGESLCNPVAPPKHYRIERYCIAMKSYEKQKDSDQLSISKSDYIKVYHQIGDSEWLWSKLLRTRQYGFVHTDYVQELEEWRIHEIEPWYYENISGEDVAEILGKGGHRSFLVRPSEKSPGDYTLFFNVNNFVHRIRIRSVNVNTSTKYFEMFNRTFESISSIIEYYKHVNLSDDCCLAASPSSDDNISPAAFGDSIRRKFFSASTLSLFGATLNVHQHASANELYYDDEESLMSKPASDEKLVTIKIKANEEDYEEDDDNEEEDSEDETENEENEDDDMMLSKRDSIGPDILHMRTDQLALKAFMHKYNEKTKKWKAYWFVLNETEHQLFYFANEKRIKEKGLIDLAYACFYPVDDSLFNKQFCFQIIIQSLGSTCTTAHYLSADSETSLKNWTDKIRGICESIKQRPSAVESPPNTSDTTTSTTTSKNTQPSTVSQSLQSLTFEKSPKHKSANNMSNTTTSTSTSSTPSPQYFTDRSLNIEIKEARNIYNLHNTNPSSSSAPTTSQNRTKECYKDHYYYCLILFNQNIFVASTKLVNNQQIATLNSVSEDTIWDEAFHFNTVPLDVNHIRILIYSSKSSSFNNSLSNLNLHKSFNFPSTSTTQSNNALSIKTLKNNFKFNRSAKETHLIGQVRIKLTDMLNKGLCETWIRVDGNTVTPQAHNASNYCSIRVKIRFNEDKVLYHLRDYQPLTRYLCNSFAYLSHVYDCVCPSNERNELVSNLMRFYEANAAKTSIVSVLKAYLDLDIERCCDKTTLFRSTTLTTSLMDYYMRSKTEKYLMKALYEPLYKILKEINREHKSFELDPSKLSVGDAGALRAHIDANLANLKTALSTLLNSMCSQALAEFPLELSCIFKHIRERVSAKWPNDKHIRIYCVSSFLFLRLICPSLLNLLNNNTLKNLLKSNNFIVIKKLQLFKNFHLINERHIKLLAKSIQTLANLTECKESFMLPLTDFLNANRPVITRFIDNISNVNEVPVSSPRQAVTAPVGKVLASPTKTSLIVSGVGEMSMCKTLANLYRLLESFQLGQVIAEAGHEKSVLLNLEELSNILDNIKMRIS